ncbi:hypothetical protein [Angustibacter aerolatus]
MPALLPGRRRRAERPDPLPAEVRAAADLRRGERVLAHARLRHGGWVVATPSALVVLPPASDEAGPLTSRYAWHDVAEAHWDPEQRLLDVRLADTDAPPVAVHLDEQPGAVPEVLRERVMSTYVLSQRVQVRGARGVTVAVRRDPADDRLFVQVVADEGVNLTRPQVADQVQALSRDLAEQVGLRL